MSSVSVSVAAVNPLTVLTPDAINSDGVTPSSESSFSGVLDASIPLDMPVEAVTEVTAKELPAELPEAATSFSALAETAADILMTLQASREMNTSLQTKALSVPISQPEPANQSNEAVLADTDATDIAPEVVVPADPVTEKPSAVNNHAETKQISSANKNQSSAVANKHNNAAVDLKSDTTLVSEPDLVAEDLAVSQSASGSVKAQIELSPDTFLKSEMPLQQKASFTVLVSDSETMIDELSLSQSANESVKEQIGLSPEMLQKYETLPQQSLLFTMVSEPDLVAEDLAVSQSASGSVKAQIELSPDSVSESEAPSQLNPSSDRYLQEAAQAKIVTQQNENAAEVIENATITQTATGADISAKVAASADTASQSNDKIQNAKADKKVQAAEMPLPDPAVATLLANMQPVADKPITQAASVTESDADLISAMPEAGDAADVTSKSESSVKTASLGNMIHDFVGMLKNNDDPVSSSARVVANNLADGEDITNIVDETSSEQVITTSQSGDISPDLATTDTPAESVNNKSDNPTAFDAGINKDPAAVNSLSHDNHGVSTTGKSALSSTGSLPEQAQGLRNITEQLPALYMKNGHVEEHELAARVMLMVGEKWQEAELQLEPQGMGKIRVQLSIDQEQQTNVQFMVQHSQAKEALDQSLPRLRELLTQHGLQPGQTQVQQQTQDNSGQSWSQQMANNSAAEQQTRRDSSQVGNAFSGSNDDEFAQTVTVSASEAAGIDFYA